MKILHWLKSFLVNFLVGDEYYRNYWKPPIQAIERPVLASQRMVVEIIRVDGSASSFEL